MDWKTATIVDGCEIRRNAVYRCMASESACIPVGCPGELGTVWPESVWFFVHDEPGALELLCGEFASRGVFYPIVMYSEDPRPERVVEAIHGGAMNYIAWPSDATAIHKALSDVAGIARKRCEHLAVRLAARDRISQLSPRELEVVRAMRNGLTSKEIGRSLEISHRTVEIHRANAMAKLGAANTAGVVTLLVQGGDAPGARVA